MRLRLSLGIGALLIALAYWWADDQTCGAECGMLVEGLLGWILAHYFFILGGAGITLLLVIYSADAVDQAPRSSVHRTQPRRARLAPRLLLAACALLLAFAFWRMDSHRRGVVSALPAQAWVSLKARLAATPKRPLPHSGKQFIGVVMKACEGRLSFQLVIATNIVLFWIALVLCVFMILFRTFHHFRARYRARRRLLYDPAIEKVLMEEPLDDVIAALKPRRWGDESVVQDVMVDSMRHLKGPPFEILRTAATQLGFVDRNLKALHAHAKFRRGIAMEALGVMRAPQAVVGIIDILAREPMDMKLVALRALAGIGNPAVLSYFVKAADDIPPTMLPRLASLMLEFGPACRPWIGELINRHRDSFPPRVLQEILRGVAFDFTLEGPR
jgi:hypothetical protein